MTEENNDRKIVFTRCEPTAPTGESLVYRCADGSEWQQILNPFDHIGSGDTVARVVDGSIKQ